MLVLSRRVGQRVLIGDAVAVTVTKVDGGVVRVGVEAPRGGRVLREELAEQSGRAGVRWDTSRTPAFP